ncbi:MAG TPA: hypothetical protein VFR29_09200 [Steroidobacteraceae bacterium]|nr:hypothetical protein [Steroidobacteraceae bacterium]
MQKVVVWISAVAVSAIAMASSGVFSELEGKYAITTQTLIDPEADSEPDRVVLWLTGKTAKDIFLAMPAAARRIHCDGTPNERLPPTKTAGGLECTGDDANGFVCSMSILLKSGQTERGYVCD